ncbi:TIR domain-containing protein [Chloroflexota bacterium]
MSKTYNIFISHSWAYSNYYDRITRLLDKRPYFSFNDYSISKDNPVLCGLDRELNIAIYNRMRPCHVVLILAGVYVTYRKWIKKEIRIAKNEFARAKPIIAIKPWANAKVSTVAYENADVLVNWNTESIIDAIRIYGL